MARTFPPLVGPYAGKPLEGELLWDLRMLGHQRVVGSRLRGQLQSKAFRVVESKLVALEDRFDPGGGEPASPELQRLAGRHADPDAVDHPRAGAAADEAGGFDEGAVGAGAAFLVA